MLVVPTHVLDRTSVCFLYLLFRVLGERTGLSKTLNMMLDQLQRCQKSLSELLEVKIINFVVYVTRCSLDIFNVSF